MIGKMLRRTWTHLLITFYDNYTIEGFEKTNKKFELPADLSHLDAATKRQMTVCNLFANQNLSIREIVKLLDSSTHQVIPALIEQGLVKERRRNRGKRGPDNRRAGGRTDTLSILPQETGAAEKTAEPEQRSNAANACSEVPMGDNSPAFLSLSPGSNRIAS